MIKEKKWNLNEIVDNYKKWDEIGTWLKEWIETRGGTLTTTEGGHAPPRNLKIFTLHILINHIWKIWSNSYMTLLILKTNSKIESCSEGLNHLAHINVEYL